MTTTARRLLAHELGQLPTDEALAQFAAVTETRRPETCTTTRRCWRRAGRTAEAKDWAQRVLAKANDAGPVPAGKRWFRRASAAQKLGEPQAKSAMLTKIGELKKILT